MTTTSVGSPRPTDAEIIKMLRDIVNPPSRRDREGISRHAIRQGEALTMASALEGAEPSPLAHITTIGHLFEVIDYDFDGSGLTVTDGNLLANTIANTFPALTNDMPHLVTTDDDSYTVSGVDYFFTEGR